MKFVIHVVCLYVRKETSNDLYFVCLLRSLHLVKSVFNKRNYLCDSLKNANVWRLNFKRLRTQKCKRAWINTLTFLSGDFIDWKFVLISGKKCTFTHTFQNLNLYRKTFSEISTQVCYTWCITKMNGKQYLDMFRAICVISYQVE